MTRIQGKPARPRRPRRRRKRGKNSESAPTDSDDLRAPLKARFGFSSLRPHQEFAIRALLAERDLVAVLPTGYGKSLIYQLATVVRRQPTVVISPLIALMQDQERHLRRYNIPVVRLDSTLKTTERREALRRVTKGGMLVVLTTPETFLSEALTAALRQAKPSLLCVDEAHCISEWGHDFRPAYLRLGAQRQALQIPQTLALTATATPQVREDIARRLRLHKPIPLFVAPHRKNLRFSVHEVSGNLKIERAGRIFRRLRRPGIIYCATKKAVDDIYGALRRARIACSRYHGGMTSKERAAAQKRFMKRGRRSVMVATSAFGMGIDKPDIRYIAHYQVPGSIEQYVQEAGRAGRDGKPAECILLFDPADLEIQEFLQKKGRPNPAQLKRVAKALVAWVRDHKPVAVKDLALSAQVPRSVCAALTAEMEQAGLVEISGRPAKVKGLLAPPALRSGAHELAAHFETKRRQDVQQLRAIHDYATADRCRSQSIRSWFGEVTPPPCGRCDVCRLNAKIYKRNS